MAKDLIFWCGQRDSNSHGQFPNGNNKATFRSLHINERTVNAVSIKKFITGTRLLPSLKYLNILFWYRYCLCDYII